MAEEIELKLALAEEHQARFLRHPLLKQALRRHVETLDNIYYDTEDLSLRRRGIGLRLRRKGHLWLQTVKLAGASTAGLSSRPEWETPYSGNFDFSAIEQVAVRDWLQRPKLLARIVPICETRFRRITWEFAARPGKVLLTLDRGWIVANGRREPISEVELELAGAPVHAIFAVATQLAQRAALTPAVLSKAERGYRLHTGAPPTPFKAGTVALSATMPPGEAFRRIALSCLEHLQQNHHGALTSDDPEYIHQMRVATRRLRAALRLFAPILPDGLADSLQLPLAALMTHLGRARDLDVLLTEIANPVLSALPNEPRLPAAATPRVRRRWHCLRRLTMAARCWPRSNRCTRNRRTPPVTRYPCRASPRNDCGACAKNCAGWLRQPVSKNRPRCMPCASASSACAMRWSSSRRWVANAPSRRHCSDLPRSRTPWASSTTWPMPAPC
jgi:inorganic triphosphatase YgiF